MLEAVENQAETIKSSYHDSNQQPEEKPVSRGTSCLCASRQKRLGIFFSGRRKGADAEDNGQALRHPSFFASFETVQR
jgi:hypothetical protein